MMKHIKFDDYNCNRMKVTGNLKIQDGDRPRFWIFKFAIHGSNGRKSNTEQIRSNFYSLCNKIKVLLNFQNQKWPLASMLDFWHYTI